MTSWINKKVLITGGTGFIGSHLAKRLHMLGAQVYILTKSENLNAPIWDRELQQSFQFIIGDICNFSFVDALFGREKFDLCFHLAAQPLVDAGDRSPVPTFEVNIMGTINILDAARNHKLAGLIIASTSHVYGENNLPFLEEYFPRPSRPYETSKACADMLAQTYAAHYQLPIAIARFVNIYGPGDLNPRIVPRTIELLLKNQQPEVFNNNVTRDYLYIEDALNAYVTLAEKINQTKGNIIYNFGCGTHFSNETIVRRIIQLLNSPIEPKISSEGRAREIVEQFVSIEKARNVLGWQPQFTLNAGLLETINWYRNYYKNS